MLPFALLALAADPASPPQTFGNWAVACDNVKRCQAVALLPAAQAGDDLAPLVVTREPGPAGGVTIAITPQGTAGRATLLIDGRPVAPTTLFETGIRVTGSEAEGVARAMATGHRLEVRDYRGKRLAAWSLAGASATLRWIDAQQGRAGTLTALVARGTKSVTSVPRAQPVPRIIAVRPRGEPAQVRPALVAAMAKQAGCDAEPTIGAPEGIDDPAFHRLDSRATLVLIPCGNGAYNYASAVFVVRDGKGTPARFDLLADPGPNGVAHVINASWDGGVLSGLNKGRAWRDCGTALRWVWDETRFRLIEARSMDACRGASEWPVTYRAEPAWR